MMIMKKLLSTTLLSVLFVAGWSQKPVIPMVYAVERTGSHYAAPTMPAADQLPVLRELPDALEGVTSFSDWTKRRSDIGHMIQHYGIGTKPTVEASQVKARMDGDTLLPFLANSLKTVPLLPRPSLQHRSTTTNSLVAITTGESTTSTVSIPT